MSLKQWKHTNGYEPYETLPEVDSEDNGKVLGVSEGQYALVNGGGGAEPLIVTLTVDGDNVYYADATYNEMKTAILAGKQVVGVIETSDAESYEPLEQLEYDGVRYGAVFYSTTLYSADADTDMSREE